MVFFFCSMSEEQINEKLEQGDWDDFEILTDTNFKKSEVYWAENIPDMSVLIMQGRICSVVKNENDVLKLRTPLVPLSKEKLILLNEKEIFGPPEL